MKQRIDYESPLIEEIEFETAAPVLELSDGQEIDTSSFSYNY